MGRMDGRGTLSQGDTGIVMWGPDAGSMRDAGPAGSSTRGAGWFLGRVLRRDVGGRRDMIGMSDGRRSVVIG